MCGVMTTFSSSKSPFLGPGFASGTSTSYTSRPAPSIFLSRNAFSRASSSNIGPLDVLIKIDVGFMSDSSSSPTNPFVSFVKEVHKTTISDSINRSSRALYSAFPKVISSAGLSLVRL